MTDELRKKVENLPPSSGVYIMRDADGVVIYVGKAVNLKNRVRSYFGGGKKTVKTERLVERVRDLEYVLTSGEVEALVLENNLIKKYSPKYNILLKDDRSYPYLKIDLRERYPVLETVRELKKDGAAYFGPYMGTVNHRNVLELVRSVFPLRTCSKDLSRLPAGHRPCVMSQIGRCAAPCAGRISPEEYGKIVDGAVNFLRRGDPAVREILTKKMLAASAASDFETAMYFRDRIADLSRLDRLQLADLPADRDMDVFAVVEKAGFAAAAFMNVRGGKLTGGGTRAAGTLPADADPDGPSPDPGTLEQFVVQYYAAAPDVPPEIILNVPLPDETALLSYLSDRFSRRPEIRVPVRGTKRGLAEMAERNAEHHLDSYVMKYARRQELTVKAAERLRDVLGLPAVPDRIECFDVSHISGTDAVAAMAVFVRGEPAKGMYRRFRMRTDRNDDFAGMRETLSRRLARLDSADASFSAVPGLILIDGGKGQLSAAEEVMKAAGREIPLAALAEREEIVFLPGRREGLRLSRRDPALCLLQRVRDEAHRFALSYHVRLRSRRMKFSALKDVPGVGDAKTDALYRAFGTMERMRAASLEELAAVRGISRRDAAAVRAYLDKTEGTELSPENP